MKILFLICSCLALTNVLSASVDNQLKERIRIKNPKHLQKKPFELKAGYEIDKINSSIGNKTEWKGANLSFGRIFELTTRVSTTTSIIGNYKVLDLNASNEDGNTFGLGLSQSFSFNFETKRSLISPFFGFSFTRGKSEIGDGIQALGINAIRDVEVGHNKYGINLGIQFIFPSGIAPFIKYDFSQRRLDSRAETTDASGVATKFSTGDSRSRKLDSESLTLGLGYIF